MNLFGALFLVALLAGSSSVSTIPSSTDNPTQASIRVALLGFTRSKAPNDSRGLEVALADSLTRDSRVALVDQSIVQSALAGFGYDGSINMTGEEARKLASAIGCDFFITGKSEEFTRSERANESHEQSYAGVMIVDGRNGALTEFDFIFDKSATREASRQSLLKALGSRVTGYVDRMIQIRAQALMPRSRDSASALSPVELIEDIPADESPRSSGFKPPEFLNRVKPEYTTEAETADITATVEAMVVFRSNGQIGGIEITRWAGFGLDKSSERAILQLKFKPATRDGAPISVRAMIRHNFRRVTDSANKPQQTNSNQPDNQ